jgi:hypothetical protein
MIEGQGNFLDCANDAIRIKYSSIDLKIMVKFRHYIFKKLNAQINICLIDSNWSVISFYAGLLRSRLSSQGDANKTIIQ